MTSVDVNDPAALSQPVSLSYLLSEYLIQGISTLLQAVLTFRQAGPSQSGLLAHAQLDNLVGSETCFSSLCPPAVCVPRLSFTRLCLSLHAPVCLATHLFSPGHASLSACLCFYILDAFASLSPTQDSPSASRFRFPQVPSLCCSSSVNS